MSQENCVHEFKGEHDPVCFKCGEYKIKIGDHKLLEMSEKIVEYIVSHDGNKIDPMNIVNYSPTGEIYEIVNLYRHIIIQESKS